MSTLWLDDKQIKGKSAPDRPLQTFCGRRKLSVAVANFLWPSQTFCGRRKLSVAVANFLWPSQTFCGRRKLSVAIANLQRRLQNNPGLEFDQINLTNPNPGKITAILDNSIFTLFAGTT